MRVQILDTNDNVIGTILCRDEAFLTATYGDRWRIEPLPPPVEPPAVVVRLTPRMFVKRLGPTVWAALTTARATDPMLNFAFDQLFGEPTFRIAHEDTLALAAHCVSQGYMTQQQSDDALFDGYLEGETAP